MSRIQLFAAPIAEAGTPTRAAAQSAYDAAGVCTVEQVDTTRGRTHRNLIAIYLLHDRSYADQRDTGYSRRTKQRDRFAVANSHGQPALSGSIKGSAAEIVDGRTQSLLVNTATIKATTEATISRMPPVRALRS